MKCPASALSIGDLIDCSIYQCRLVPLLTIGLKPVYMVSVVLLGSTPNFFNPIEVWSISDVIDQWNIDGFAFGNLLDFSCPMNTATIHKDGNLCGVTVKCSNCSQYLNH